MYVKFKVCTNTSILLKLGSVFGSNCSNPTVIINDVLFWQTIQQIMVKRSKTVLSSEFLFKQRASVKEPDFIVSENISTRGVYYVVNIRFSGLEGFFEYKS